PRAIVAEYDVELAPRKLSTHLPQGGKTPKLFNQPIGGHCGLGQSIGHDGAFFYSTAVWRNGFLFRIETCPRISRPRNGTPPDMDGMPGSFPTWASPFLNC